MSNDLLSTSARGASFLILLQVASRALTFIVNQILLRFLSPQILGVATQLELFSISTLCFSRESIRVALQRRGKHHVEESSPVKEKDEVSKRQDAAGSLQQAVNLSYVSIVLGVVLTIVFQYLYVRGAADEVSTTPYFRKSLNLFAIATILELLHEPFFVTAQHELAYSIRTSAEMQATFLRCIFTCGIAILANRKGLDVGVLPFAIGQLIYAVSLLVGYAFRLTPLYARTGTTHFPHKPSGPAAYIPQSLLKLSALLYAQSLFKQLLTSGDAYLVAVLTSLSSQGAYALATNYGGLLARVLFQPIEEASRTLFARLLPGVGNKDTQSRRDLQQAVSYLETLLHIYSILAIFLIFFAPPCTPALLNIVAGQRWSETEAPDVLAAYCYYIPFFAFNGILEAYMSAVASPKQLQEQSLFMFQTSILFAVAGYVVLGIYRMGATGLVAANAVVMAARIIYSWRFVVSDLEFRDSRIELRKCMPNPVAIAVGVGARATLWQFGASEATGGPDIAKAVALAAVQGLVVLTLERAFLLECWYMMRPAREPEQDSSSEKKDR